MSRKDWTMADIRNTFGVQASYQGKEDKKEYKYSENIRLEKA